MKYTFKQFRKEYPNDNACLEAVFQYRYGQLKFCPKCATETRFYRVKKRQCYACSWCGYQLFPLAHTIFHKTTTSLWSWFYAIYLFSVSKNGVSASELQRHLGVTYKTAWRMCQHIRLLMEQDNIKLGGSGKPVEADEMEFGGRTSKRLQASRHTMVLGAIERKGNARVHVTDWASTNRAMSFIRANLESGIDLYTDGSHIYKWTDKEFKHSVINHKIHQWVDGDIHTNTIEGLWSFIQNSITGTYRGISPKYLQHYLDEFIFRYNHRDEAIFQLLFELAMKLSG